MRAAIPSLFRDGNEARAFGRPVEWLDAERCETEQVLLLFSQPLQPLQPPEWSTRILADGIPETGVTAGIIRRALNTESSFDVACVALLRWADLARWDETYSCAVEHLFAELAGAM